jgi:hypothetical protein
VIALATMYEGEFAVFSAGGEECEEWVIAKDEEDAAAVWAEGGGGVLDWGASPLLWKRCDPAEILQWSEDESLPAVPTTYAELAKRGRGYLGSAVH